MIIKKQVITKNKIIFITSSGDVITRPGDVDEWKKIRTNKMAVTNSTKGYCQEIFFPQYRHFLFRIKKLKIGIKSCQFKICLQRGQKERPFKKLPPVSSLYIRQFKKEPTSNPKIKINK